MLVHGRGTCALSLVRKAHDECDSDSIMLAGATGQSRPELVRYFPRVSALKVVLVLVLSIASVAMATPVNTQHTLLCSVSLNHAHLSRSEVGFWNGVLC